MTTAVERRPTVLLVEDEPAIGEIAAAALGEQGFEVRTVASAGEALRCLNSGAPVDVLFTDINLSGGMDGAALAQRARELRPGLPVLYASGRAAALERLQPVEGAMVVPKPYNLFSLGRLLDCLLAPKLTVARLNGPAKV